MKSSLGNDAEYSANLKQLLSDLAEGLGVAVEVPPKAQLLSWKSKCWLAFGTVSAAILLLYESFSSMATIIGTFLTFGKVIFGMSMAFALLSVIFFISYQLVLLARAEQISWLKIPKKLKQYREEKQALCSLVFLLNHRQLTMACLQNDITYDTYADLVQHIQTRLKFLETKAQELEKSRMTKGATVRNYLVCACLGLWIFSSGFFFASYTLSMALALLGLSIPVVGLIGFSAFMGILSVISFWGGQRKELVQALDRLSGIDERWVEELSSPVNLVTIPQAHFNCLPLKEEAMYSRSTHDDLPKRLSPVSFCDPAGQSSF